MCVPADWEAAPGCRSTPSNRWERIKPPGRYAWPKARIGNIGKLNDLIFRITNLLQVAFHAARLARLADASAMPDQLMRKNDPLIFRNDLHQVLLYFLGIRVASEVQPPGHALHMSIDYYARSYAKGRSEFDVGGLARDARKRQQLLHGARDFARELFDDLFAGALN